eukprot:GHVH01016545.1.p1 GENE.GHVH01016545.1~~GHVH01016545.1.p1  ORF type:complete len:434 (-),score=37.13 GHVH01016545.1:635-1936(-)
MQCINRIKHLAECIFLEIDKQEEIIKSISNWHLKKSAETNSECVVQESSSNAQPVEISSLFQRLRVINEKMDNLSRNVINLKVEQVDVKPNKATEDQAAKLHRRRLKYEKQNSCMKSTWRDIDCETKLTRCDKATYMHQSSQFIHNEDGSLPEIWGNTMSAEQGHELLKYHGVLRVDPSFTSTKCVPELSLKEASATTGLLSPEEMRLAARAAPGLHHTLKPPTTILQMARRSSISVGKLGMTSDIRSIPVLPEQLANQKVLSKDPIFCKLQDSEFIERCYEESQLKRTGINSLTESERLARAAPRDEYEVTDSFRIRDHFISLTVRILLGMFFLDAPRDYYFYVCIMVSLFFIGVLEYPFRWIDHLIQKTFSRPSVNTQMHRLDTMSDVGGGAADANEDPPPHLWVRCIYQTVISFFLLFMPWWAPDPHYIQ